MDVYLFVKYIIKASNKLKGNNENTYISQLYWNNFGFYLQYHFNTISTPLKLPVKSNEWTKSDKYFKAWKQGKTGIPFVDAFMRQLDTTGYCHNRGRLVVSNILAKWFRTNWRKGEKYFAKNII